LDQANGDFHLTNDSPCIDAGDNSDPYLQPTDIDGDDRIIDDPAVADTGNSNGEPAIVDMGAFEKYLNDPSPPPIKGGNEWPPPGQNRRPSDGGTGGGGNGIFGDIVKSSVIGYHLDGWTAEGIEIYMPVTKGFKALKGALLISLNEKRTQIKKDFCTTLALRYFQFWGRLQKNVWS
jgi:hypothetical protein